MHKEWIQDALRYAPENIDGNMTINEFVDTYSKLLDVVCNLGNSIGSMDAESIELALKKLKK